MHSLSMQYGPLTTPLPPKAKASPVTPTYCINYQLLTKPVYSLGECHDIVRGLRQLQPTFGQTIRGLRQRQPMFGQVIRGLRQRQPIPDETFRGLRQPQPIPDGTFRGLGQPLCVIARNEAIQNNLALPFDEDAVLLAAFSGLLQFDKVFILGLVLLVIIIFFC